MAEFFGMSGYGHYIWSAYGITIFFLILLWLLSKRFAKTSETELTKLAAKGNIESGKNGNETQV